jgi:hypothetical protein
MNLKFRHLDYYPERISVHGVLHTVLHAFFLRTLVCSEKNTAVLVVPSIVLFMVFSTALCLHSTALLQS